MKIAGLPPEDEKPTDTGLGRWFLMALQVLAMALCVCLLARMWVEDAFKLPHSMCVESPPPIEHAPE